MTRLSILLVLLLASAHAQAQARSEDALPSPQQRIHYLGDYALALGRKFGCDNDRDAMVAAIQRYTYVLQLDNDASTEARETSRKNLSDGVSQSKANQASCAGAVKGVEDAAEEARSNHALMQNAAHTASLVAGAATACKVPKEQIDSMLNAVLLYTKTNNDTVADGIKAGSAEVTSSQISCDTATSVFKQVKSIFAP